MPQTALDLVTVYISKTEWENIATVPGTLLDPYRITIDPLSKESEFQINATFFCLVPSYGLADIIERIQSIFPTDIEPDTISIFNPSLRPLFAHYVEAVCNVCFPFTSEPKELAYIVCARWPGFASPILEEWKVNDDGIYAPPSEESRLRLLRLFNPSLSSAVENLYPRSMDRMEWSALHSLPGGSYLSQPQGLQLSSSSIITPDGQKKEPELSVLAMFVVVASFLASYNPAKTDYRMFGRGVDERARKKKKGGGTRRTKATTTAKVRFFPFFMLRDDFVDLR